jgi:hypothetical protein
MTFPFETGATYQRKGNPMSKDKAYDVAVDMHKHEHDRWVQNAFVLLAGLVSALIGYRTSDVPLLVALLIATIASLVFVLLALTIRGSTWAWRETVRYIELKGQDTDLKPFQILERKLKKYTRRGGHCKDFSRISCEWRISWQRFQFRRAKRRKKWRHEVLLSITRLHTLIGCFSTLFFGTWLLVELINNYVLPCLQWVDNITRLCDR